MFSQEFLGKMLDNLNFRRKSKMEILRIGGQQALSHSYRNIRCIDFALKRIKEGQYGLCTNCGCVIDTKRLEIIPETPFCTQCANETQSH